MKETSLLRLLPCTPEDTRCKRDASRAAGTQLLLRVLHCPRHALPGSQRPAKSIHNYFQQCPFYLLTTRLTSRTWNSDLPGASEQEPLINNKKMGSVGQFSVFDKILCVLAAECPVNCNCGHCTFKLNCNIRRKSWVYLTKPKKVLISQYSDYRKKYQ